MADGFVCDACDATLLLESDVRYIVDIRGYAAYDPIEISPAALKADFDAQMSELLAQMENSDAQDLEDAVHKEFRVDLCPACWARYIQDPIAGLRPPKQSGDSQASDERAKEDDTPPSEEC